MDRRRRRRRKRMPGGRLDAKRVSRARLEVGRREA